VETNRRRSRNEFEYELLDTGVFNDDRFFDAFVEYAKAGPEDILVRITAANRGPDPADLHLLPTLWFRNDWASWIAESNRAAEKPTLRQVEAAKDTSAVAVTHSLLGEFVLSCEGEVPLLFTENETNNERLFPEHPNASPYVKDGINNCVVQGNQGAVNPEKQGTKVAAHYRVTIAPGQSATVRLRLTAQSAAGKSGKTKSTPFGFGAEFDQTLAVRLQEADECYRSLTPPSVSADAANVMRQALAGTLWSKQFFFFDGDTWLDEHHSNPLHTGYRAARNSEWFHFHDQHPFVFHVQGQEYRVDYLPAESNTGMFGGNSNWRGPVWMPVNIMLIRALLNFYAYYGDTFTIECPTGSGRMMNLFEVAQEISDRLTGAFLRDAQGRRAVYGGTEKFQTDPHWRDHILFYEYFHGDNGAGLGASHQTGWTGLVAKLIQLFGVLDAKQLLEGGKAAAFVRGTPGGAVRK